jgi:tetratricopeptide (TPR) repeat protein
MKWSFLAIFCLVHFQISANDISNSEWVKVDLKRKDGSAILDHSGLQNTSLEYFFKSRTVVISIDAQVTFEKEFSIEKGVLKIGNDLIFQIDTLNSDVLVLTEIPRQPKSDDKINTITFINKNVYFKYLLANNKVRFLSDTLVQCEKIFSPVFKGQSLTHLFMQKFNEGNRSIDGDFILNSDGRILALNIRESIGFNDKELARFRDVFLTTNGLWELPKGTGSLSFRVDYRLKFMNKPPLRSTSFQINPPSRPAANKHHLSQGQKDLADSHFNKGLKFSQNAKAEKGIQQFLRVVEIDSLYLDAYYNLAYLYWKKGDKKAACETWSKLKALGQKQGEGLYDDNCN